MTLEDIIKELSKVYTERDSLVLHRSYEAHPSIKALKRFRYALISATSTKVEELYSNVYSSTCTIDELQDKWKELDKVFLGELFKWLKDGCNKQISDNNN